MAKIETIFITAKCSDLCHITFIDGAENEIGERDNYVPDWMPENHYGDYVELHINVETGQILNWKTPTQKELDKSIEKKF
jgi:hypothetical protein